MDDFSLNIGNWISWALIRRQLLANIRDIITIGLVLGQASAGFATAYSLGRIHDFAQQAPRYTHANQEVIIFRGQLRTGLLDLADQFDRAFRPGFHF